MLIAETIPNPDRPSNPFVSLPCVPVPVPVSASAVASASGFRFVLTGNPALSALFL